MKTRDRLLAVVLVSACLAASGYAAESEAPETGTIRDLKEKMKTGAALTAEEQEQLDRVRVQRTGGVSPKPAMPGRGDPTSGDHVDEKKNAGRRGVFRESEVDYPLILEKIEGNERISPNPIIYRKPKGEGPFPVVCFLPGGAGTTREVTREEFGRDFAKSTRSEFLRRGYMVVGVYVKSYGHQGESMRTSTPFEEARLVIEHLKRLPFVDPASIVFFGGSGGGNVAMGTASLSRDLACVVVGEPATVIMTGLLEHYEDRKSPEFEERMRRPNEFLSAERRAEVEELLSRIACPVLVLHSDVHPIQHVNLEVIIPALERLGKPVEVKRYPGLEHGFYWQNPPGLIDEVDAFLRKHIRTQPRALEN